jgi:hypothetical protein
MRIISPGQLPEEKLFKGTCSNCKTVFECKRSEGKFSSDQRDGSMLEVTCPFCNKKAWAYPRNDGRKIPDFGYDNYRWRDDTSYYQSSLASQIANPADQNDR